MDTINNYNNINLHLLVPIATTAFHHRFEQVEDFSQYSCRSIYNQVPDPGYRQCQFARTCNEDGEGVWLPIVFCPSSGISNRSRFLHFHGLLMTFISLGIILWMVLLFRLLSSTAEDYFSPSLEMCTVQLKLPPRFAGVTLLALGNGAADISSTVQAIVMDETDGYQLALGALTGAAMMAGGVIAGLIILNSNIPRDGSATAAASSSFVSCRGALVRDVVALIVTTLVVWNQLASGVIEQRSINVFVTLYVVFVITVLVADIYHRIIVVPRLTTVVEHEEHHSRSQDPSVLVTSEVERPAADRSSALAKSRDDNPPSLTNINTRPARHQLQPCDGRQDEWLQQDGIVLPDATSSRTTLDEDTGGGGYALLHEHIDYVCSTNDEGSFGASNWSGAWHDTTQDVIRHAKDVWVEYFSDGDLHTGERFLLLCELPFTIVRKATIPIPCDGYYNRGVLALSVACSPLWFAFYLWDGYEINVLSVKEGTIPYAFLSWLCGAIAMGILLLRFAPGGDGSMRLIFAVPLALYGFVMAATWMDLLADHLVALLDFIGIVFRIPRTIMGLTVLAWGNSIGDLSTNITMARKGFANMALTACFAEPVFNILIGLGLGFSNLASVTGKSDRVVTLTPSIRLGFVCMVLNGSAILIAGVVFGKGKLEPSYGYIGLGLYVLYLTSSIGLQFTSYRDDNRL